MGERGDKQRRRIMNCVRSHIRKYGHSPTLQEIASTLDLGTSTVWHHVNKLKSDGELMADSHRSRTLRPIRKGS